MRNYPRNSPEAAARIVALLLISDGHVCRSEVQALERLEVERQLGLAPGQFGRLLHTLCEDLLCTAQDAGATVCSVDDATLASLLAEVDAPELQRTVVRLASAAAQADRHLAPGEALVLAAVQRHWGLSPKPLAQAA